MEKANMEPALTIINESSNWTEGAFNAVMSFLNKNKVQITNVDYPNRITVKMHCLPVEISYEMCSCHGGRMWLAQDNTGIQIELASLHYDELLGITSPQTELAYYIENKLLPTLAEFKNYIYVSETIGEYGTDKVYTRYFKSPQDMGNDAFSKDVDPFAIDEVEYQPPNPNIKYIYKFQEVDKDGKYVFAATKYQKPTNSDDFEIDREFTIKFWMYRK